MAGFFYLHCFLTRHVSDKNTVLGPESVTARWQYVLLSHIPHNFLISDLIDFPRYCLYHILPTFLDRKNVAQ